MCARVGCLETLEFRTIVQSLSHCAVTIPLLHADTLQFFIPYFSFSKHKYITQKWIQSMLVCAHKECNECIKQIMREPWPLQQLNQSR